MSRPGPHGQSALGAYPRSSNTFSLKRSAPGMDDDSTDADDDLLQRQPPRPVAKAAAAAPAFADSSDDDIVSPVRRAASPVSASAVAAASRPPRRIVAPDDDDSSDDIVTARSSPVRRAASPVSASAVAAASRPRRRIVAPNDDSSDDDIVARPAAVRRAAPAAAQPPQRRIVVPKRDESSEEESDDDDDDDEESEEDEEEESYESSGYNTSDEVVRGYYDRPETEAEKKRGRKVQSILGYRADPAWRKEHPDSRAEPDYLFLLKFVGLSYHHTTWASSAEVVSLYGAERKLANYYEKHIPEYTASQHTVATTEAEAEDHEHERTGVYFNKAYLNAERIVTKAKDANRTVQYLVKWHALGYDEATWETEDYVRNTLCLDALIARYNAWLIPPSRTVSYARQIMTPERLEALTGTIRGSTFLNDCKLRDYQEQGVAWLTHNWIVKTNCILGDEMGLGKTVQVLIFLEMLRRQNVPGPFLVIAPLATLGHWTREANLWTDMNALCYMGTKDARDRIFMNEFFYKTPASLNSAPRSGARFNVLITTYEMVLKDISRFKNLHWAGVIIDEGHRLKNEEASLYKLLAPFNTEFKCVMTGTPVQNNLGELYALLKFLMREKTGKAADVALGKTMDAFLERFTPMTEAKLAELFQLLGPRLLRREKGDVEKSIPPKVEILVKVPMTRAQKETYKLVLEGRRHLLVSQRGGAAAAQSTARNLCMELRKVCNHPWLIKDGEARAMEALGYIDKPAPYDLVMETMLRQSAKLLFLDGLLARFRKEKERVLIFSQFVMVIDLLENYLKWRGYPYEYIHGGVEAFSRQVAVDRFQDPESDSFIFIISTKAGGCGINLTAASKVIIYDSDWNPQNDLQAQARCHRIGQKKEVEVYRVLTENTYEERMFEVASQKLGLDHIILHAANKTQGKAAEGSMGLSTGDIERVLKHGAYDLYKDDTKDEETAYDVDAILERSKKVVHGAQGKDAKGGDAEKESGEQVQAVRGLAGFSKVKFSIDGQDQIENDPEFWNKILPEKVSSLTLQRKINGGTPPQDAEEVAAFMTDLQRITEEEIASLGPGPLMLSDSVAKQRQVETLLTQVAEMRQFQGHKTKLTALLAIAAEPKNRVRKRVRRDPEGNIISETPVLGPANVAHAELANTWGSHDENYAMLAATHPAQRHKVDRALVLQPWCGRYLSRLAVLTKAYGYGQFGKVVEQLREEGLYPDTDLLSVQQREEVLASNVEAMYEYIAAGDGKRVKEASAAARKKAPPVKKAKKKAGKKRAVIDDDDSSDESAYSSSSDDSSAGSDTDFSVSEYDSDDDEALQMSQKEVEIDNVKGEFRGMFDSVKVQLQGIEGAPTALEAIRDYRTAELVQMLRTNDNALVDAASPPVTVTAERGWIDKKKDLRYKDLASSSEPLYPGTPLRVTVKQTKKPSAEATKKDGEAKQAYLICVGRIAGKVKKSVRLARSYVREVAPGETAEVELIVPGASGAYQVAVALLEKGEADKEDAETQGTQSTTHDLHIAKTAAVVGKLKERLFMPWLRGSVPTADVHVSSREDTGSDANPASFPVACHLRSMRCRYLTEMGEALTSFAVKGVMLFPVLTRMSAMLLTTPTLCSRCLYAPLSEWSKEDLAGLELAVKKKDKTAEPTIMSAAYLKDNEDGASSFMGQVVTTLAFSGCVKAKAVRVLSHHPSVFYNLGKLATRFLAGTLVSKKPVLNTEAAEEKARPAVSPTANKRQEEKEKAKQAKEAEQAKKLAEKKEADTLYAVVRYGATTGLRVREADGGTMRLDVEAVKAGAFKGLPAHAGDAAPELVADLDGLLQDAVDAFVPAAPGGEDASSSDGSTASAVDAVRVRMLETLACKQGSKGRWKLCTESVDKCLDSLKLAVQLRRHLGAFFKEAGAGADGEAADAATLLPVLTLNKTLLTALKGADKKLIPGTWTARQAFSFLRRLHVRNAEFGALDAKGDGFEETLKPTIAAAKLQGVVVPKLLAILRKEIPMVEMPVLITSPASPARGGGGGGGGDEKAEKKKDDEKKDDGDAKKKAEPEKKAAKKEEDAKKTPKAHVKKGGKRALLEPNESGDESETAPPPAKRTKAAPKPAAKKTASKKSAAKPSAKKAAPKKPASGEKGDEVDVDSDTDVDDANAPSKIESKIEVKAGGGKKGTKRASAEDAAESAPAAKKAKAAPKGSQQSIDSFFAKGGDAGVKKEEAKAEKVGAKVEKAEAKKDDVKVEVKEESPEEDEECTPPVGASAAEEEEAATPVAKSAGPSEDLIFEDTAESGLSGTPVHAPPAPSGK